MRFPVYISWLPIKEGLTDFQLKKINNYLGQNYRPYKDQKKKFPQLYKLNGLFKTITIKTEVISMTVAYNGLLIFKGKKALNTNQDVMRKFCVLCQLVTDNIFELIYGKKTRVISKDIPLLILMDKENMGFWKLVLASLDDNFSRSIINFENFFNHQLKRFAQNISIKVKKTILSPKGFILYLGEGISSLIEIRFSLGSFIKVIHDIIEKDTFRRYFLEIVVNDFYKRKKTIGFGNESFEKYSVLLSLIREYSEIVGNYFLQTFIVILTISLVSISFVVLLLENVVFTLIENILLYKVIIITIVAILYYVWGYIFIRRLARRIENLTIDYFEIEKFGISRSELDRPFKMKKKYNINWMKTIIISFPIVIFSINLFFLLASIIYSNHIIDPFVALAGTLSGLVLFITVLIGFKIIDGKIKINN